MGLKDLLTPTDHSIDFECRNCGREFSTELTPGEDTTCPDCGSADVSRVEAA